MNSSPALVEFSLARVESVFREIDAAESVVQDIVALGFRDLTKISLPRRPDENIAIFKAGTWVISIKKVDRNGLYEIELRKNNKEDQKRQISINEILTTIKILLGEDGLEYVRNSSKENAIERDVDTSEEPSSNITESLISEVRFVFNTLCYQGGIDQRRYADVSLVDQHSGNSTRICSVEKADNGVVDAMVRAINQCLQTCIAFPRDMTIDVTEFSIGAASMGSDAVGRATVGIRYEGKNYSGSSGNTDINLAAAYAYLEAINRMIAVHFPNPTRAE